MKLFAAALALTLSLAGCGPVDGDPIRSGASAPDSVPRQDAVTVAQLRQQAEQNGSLAVVLYLGSVPERTADVDAALDSLQEQPWQFVTDIPADRWVTAPGGGRELYCLFAVSSRDTLFLYEKQDPQYPHQTGRELYCGRDGQPILLLCNGSPEVPDITAVVYCTTDEGVFDTDPADADRMCFLPTDADTEGSQLPFTASYITPYPELNVEEADLFYQEGTPEVPFQTNQEWYATFTGEDGSRYAVTLEDEDTLALKFYLDGEESYMSLVSTVYFARQEAMG